MTVVVGIETEQGVLMGADSCVSNGNRNTLYNMVKVWRHGPCILGMAGEVRTIQAIQTRLIITHPPLPTVTLQAWVITELLPAVREIAEEVADEDDEWQLLVGIGHELWSINHRWNVLRSWNCFDAIGSGQSYALGSLDATARVNIAANNMQEDGEIVARISPEARIVFALEAAVEYCADVNRPFNYASNYDHLLQSPPDKGDNEAQQDNVVVPFIRPNRGPQATIVKDDPPTGGDDATG
jgi:ATP-dependent protease HslVU (ClpYQ) peptidase subunit